MLRKILFYQKKLIPTDEICSIEFFFIFPFVESRFLSLHWFISRWLKSIFSKKVKIQQLLKFERMFVRASKDKILFDLVTVWCVCLSVQLLNGLCRCSLENFEWWIAHLHSGPLIPFNRCMNFFVCW